MKVLRCFLLLASLFIGILPCAAITYYLSATGNDANNGRSINAAWRTLGRVNMANFRGDTILLQGGITFNGRLYFNRSDSGSATKPIVIDSYGSGRATIYSDTTYGMYLYNTGGFIIRNLYIVGSGRLTNHEAGLQLYLDTLSTPRTFFRFDNLEIFGYRKPGILVGSWAGATGYSNLVITNTLVHDNGKAGIEFYAGLPFVHRNITIRNCRVYNNPGIETDTTGHSGSGITLGGVDIGLVEYCKVYNNGWLHKYLNSGGPAGIWTYRSDSITFQYNESHNNQTGTLKDGSGFDVDGNCTNAVVQYNYSHDNDGGGYVIAQYSGATQMRNITIRYNISENDGRKGDQGAIHLWASGSSGGISGVNIYNNTVFSKPQAGVSVKTLFIRPGPISGLRIRNNIFQTTGGVELVRMPASATSYLLQGNSYWPSGSTFRIIYGATTYSSLATWRTATGQERLNGTDCGIQANALFADTTQGTSFANPADMVQLKRYQLLAGAAQLNTGLHLRTLFNINVGLRDFWGNSLANRTTFHIGAFQGAALAMPAAITRNALITEQNEGFSKNETGQQAGNAQPWMQVLSTERGLAGWIRFGTERGARVVLTLHHMGGQLAQTVFTGVVTNDGSQQVPLHTGLLLPGMYIVRLQAGSRVVTQKVMVGK